MLDNYDKFVQKTKQGDVEAIISRINTPQNLDILHSVMGISGESGELIDAFKKHLFYGKDLDVENIKEELGDLLWYISVGAVAVGVSMEEIIQQNMDKLSKRYPNGHFTAEDAMTRADKIEENI